MLRPKVRIVREPLLDIHLIDGTYELFRHFYAVPSARDAEGREVGAVRGVLGSVLGMLNSGATHVGVATDHVIESFRNELWPGYKTGDGIDPALLSQFPLLETTLQALGVVVWPMVEFEADDALAAAAFKAAEDPRVTKVIVCTPDKDLAQVVSGTRIVQLNRRTREMSRRSWRDRQVRRHRPHPFPTISRSSAMQPMGIRGCRDGARSRRRAVLAKFGHIESIPADHREWKVNAASPGALVRDTRAANAITRCCSASLATLRTDVPVFDDVDELRWTGPTPAFPPIAAAFDAAVTDEKSVKKPRRVE